MAKAKKEVSRATRIMRDLTGAALLIVGGAFLGSNIVLGIILIAIALVIYATIKA